MVDICPTFLGCNACTFNQAEPLHFLVTNNGVGGLPKNLAGLLPSKIDLFRPYLSRMLFCNSTLALAYSRTLNPKRPPVHMCL